MELWIFLVGGFVALILLALRNGAFRPRRHGDHDGSEAINRNHGILRVMDSRAGFEDRDRRSR